MSVNNPLTESQLQHLKTQLSEGDKPIVVSFLKKDGDLRVMKCTQNLELIPPSCWPKDTTEKKANETSIRVYDVNAVGWRSFLVNNIVNFYE